MEDDLLTRIQAEIAQRLVELEPLVKEAADLEAALSDLDDQCEARRHEPTRFQRILAPTQLVAGR
jgi:hypothetical protein